MPSYKDYFKGKRITVLGLGLLGKQLGCIEFLAQCGAQLIVTDLKTKKELQPSLNKLKKFKNITYVLGKHRFKDFENRDFILKGQGTPILSPYIAHARKNNIPIEMDDTLFIKYAPNIRIIGVTGTRGKTYTTQLIYFILKQAKQGVFIGGNIQGTAALPLLKKIKQGDTVVFELSSWQLQGFGETKISPHIAVFTTFMPDHMNYYNNNIRQYWYDKAQIFRYQTKKDLLIVRPEIVPFIKKYKEKIMSKLVIAKPELLPNIWMLHTPGTHIRANTSAAIAVAEALGIKKEIIKKAVTIFKGVPGRLEFVKKYRGIKIYNDTCATTPEATVAGILAVADTSQSNVVLIAGGTDKKLDSKILADMITTSVREVVLLPGTGTEKLLPLIHKHDFYIAKNIQLALKKALAVAQTGDTILFSPGFTSFGMFMNEYDRGDKFIQAVKLLK